MPMKTTMSTMTTLEVRMKGRFEMPKRWPGRGQPGWLPWLSAELRNEPDAFGPQSFGLIALGSLLKVVKEVITLAAGA
jgi:hypothetical protein